MSKTCLSVFFIIAFLQKGISDSSVRISQKKEGADRLNVTCVLSPAENLTQVNWEKLQGSNRTNLGVFHPQYGLHIQSEHKGKVKIEGRQYPQAYSSISLELAMLNKSEEICCVFMTFPSGILRQCTKFTDNEDITNINITKTEAQGAGPKLSLLKQLALLIMGSILSLVFITLSVCFCHRCCCRRKQVFNVQQANHTDQSASTETHTEGTPEVQATHGFDPTKLYAKIKEDLYYGRLWKSYQGRARVPTQGSPRAPRQIYYRLNESPPPQSEEKEENTPKGPETATSSPLDSNN